MPYIITTRRSYEQRPGTNDLGQTVEQTTRRAVATLDEAREAARLAVHAAHAAYGQSWNNRWEGWAVTEWYIGHDAGGTVGPLPDGTVIDVARVGWRSLVDAIPTLGTYRVPRSPDADDVAAMLDVYNAAQQAS